MITPELSHEAAVELMELLDRTVSEIPARLDPGCFTYYLPAIRDNLKARVWKAERTHEHGTNQPA